MITKLEILQMPPPNTRFKEYKVKVTVHNGLTFDTYWDHNTLKKEELKLKFIEAGISEKDIDDFEMLVTDIYQENLNQEEDD